MAEKNENEQTEFEKKVRIKVQDRIKAQLKEIKKKNKKIKKKCNCGRIK